MSQADQPDEAEVHVSPPGRRWRVPLAVAGVTLLAGLGWAWLDRKDIAETLIADQLENNNLTARYTVESIGARKQVLRDIVIGDPKAPDFTAERIEVETTTRWGLPGLGQITLVKPRIYGSYRAGKLSFGKLDPLIFTGSTEPFSLPDLDIAVVDGRGRLDSDYGAIGLKLEGEGALRGGFKGILAAAAPELAGQGCTARGVTAFGTFTVSAEKPRFNGPLRLDSLGCPQQRLSLGKASLQADVIADPRFDGAEGSLALAAAGLVQGSNRVAESAVSGRFVFRKQALTAHYDLTARRMDTPAAQLAKLAVNGTIRSAQGLARLDIEGEVTGSELAAGRQVDALLADLQRGGEGSLAAPLVAQVRQGLQREARSSDLAGQFIARRTGDLWNLIVPQARIKGSSGQGLLSLSRLQLSLGGPVSPRISGNFTTGGRGLPQIAGRLERAAGGQLVTRLVVAEYRAGSASIAMPQLMLVQSGNGAFGFSGEARVSGALPGGEVRNLLLPLKGNWSARTGLALWRQCTTLAFDRLRISNLSFDRRSLMFCPARGGAIVRTGAGGGLAIAAGLPSLDISGRLGETPIRIASGAIGFAYPGTIAARSLDVALGPAATASKFRIANVTANVSDQVAGQFAGSDISLYSVPLDIHEAAGDWHFAGGQLSISGGNFKLVDRQTDARFQPLIARDAVLTLVDNRIVAQALLREPGSDREVVQARIGHNLAGGIGQADLEIANITFNKQLQPDTLSRLALGIVANAEGSVKGLARVDWTPGTVTSHGTFSTGGIDFAAAFGPVKGVEGTVVFTDLLGLVTAPDQRLKIASINPGIEAENGELSFELQGNNVLQVNGAHWPFLDGSLVLEPTRMVLGAAETRRYTLSIAGLDAAQFINRLQLTNIAATGTFDGRLPLVFDKDGGRIDGGLLISRQPGGNVSYIGPLSYKDMSPMVNFAFDALKSINFRQMRIEMNGALEGEIVTRVSFEGIRQGKGTKQNFVTKALAKLPIRFNVNIRAPFFRLMSSFKSLYDPGFIVDPRLIGLVDGNGKAYGVQPPASENKR